MKRLQRKAVVFSLLLTIFSLGFYSCQDDETDLSDYFSQQDHDFAINATYSNIAEIQLGELAFQKSDNDSVMNYGKEMIMDHNPIRYKMDSIARELKITLPTKMDKSHQTVYNRLSGLTSFAFDTAYMRSQILDHQAALSMMEKQRDSGNNKKLIDYAKENLILLDEHLQHATRLSAWLNETGGVNQ
ncbi:MAG TPA: DUF4142 domain-containing protein [Bacteroidales bacterium]|nr:DUF4142 domain-containing protein [Bacteroidales bacterium]